MEGFFTLDRIIEIAGFTVGLAYLYYEYHANRLMWLMSVVMPAISLWVYFNAGLYADFAINVYYLIIAVYGFVAWTSGVSEKSGVKSPLKISRMPGSYYMGAAAVLACLYAVLVWLLIGFTDSTVPWWDAFTTALSIVAMWMLARKYVEQWLAWLVVDVVCVGLDIYKGIYFYAVLYAVYSVIAVLGYRKWLCMMRQGL